MKVNLRGLKPKCKIGESLSYDIWSWRPLWHLIVNSTQDLDEKDRTLGQVKKELEITGEKHLYVINSLKKILRDRSHGEVQRAIFQSPYVTEKGKKKIVEDVQVTKNPYYKVDWEDVIDLLRFCKSNDGFAVS